MAKENTAVDCQFTFMKEKKQLLAGPRHYEKLSIRSTGAAVIILSLNTENTHECITYKV
jgi:hypothetical protein